MAFFVGLAIVGLSCFDILLHTPAMLVEFSYAIMGIRQSASLIEFKSSAQILRIALTTFSQNVCKIRTRQVIAILNSLFIPENSSIDIWFNTHTILEESTYRIHQIIIHIEIFKITVLNAFQNINDIFTIPSMRFRTIGIVKDKMLVVYRNLNRSTIAEV